MGFMKRVAMRGGHSGGRGYGSLPFEIRLDSMGETEKYERRQDVAAREAFNEAVARWAERVSGLLKGSVRSRVRRDLILSQSIAANLRYDRRYGREVNQVGFSFVREGIYIERGAGRGYGGYKGGSTWYNRKGERRSTAGSSLMKMGTGKRAAKAWFNPVIEACLPALADIVESYSAGLSIDATRVFIR